MSSYPLLNIFLSMLWFFLWALWVFLVVWIAVDIFRSSDLSGWAKAGWFVLVVLVPLLGVLTYLIARGVNMHERQASGYGTHVYDRQGSAGSASELSRLADLRDRGVIDEEEFRKGKDKFLDSYSPGMTIR